jgi:RimJ/RimL family protein N-acetyltransferase
MSRLTAPPYVHRVCEHRGARSLQPTDGKRLGELMYDSYRGTVDDEGGTAADAIDEAQGTLQGKYGNVLWYASFVVEHEDGRLASACVVTDYSQLSPLLAFSLTRTQDQRQGLAGCLIERALAALHASGAERLHLVVTETNDNARRLYGRLGFSALQDSSL